MKKLITILGCALFLAACTPAQKTETVTPTVQPTVKPTVMATPKESSAGAMNKDGVLVGGAMMVKTKNIVENASAAANLTTLVTAVKAGDLATSLSGAGPFTVFAPTNDAFVKVPKATLEDLLKPANKTKLQGVLKYHVVAGSYLSKDLKDGQKLKTLQGDSLTVSIKSGKVMVNGATVQTADVISSNGISHVIDTVLMPGESMVKSSASPSASVKASASASAMPKY